MFEHGLDWTGLDWTGHVKHGLDWTGQLDWTVELDYWSGFRIRFNLFDRRNLNDSKIYKYF